jgi:hypothetical protein
MRSERQTGKAGERNPFCDIHWAKGESSRWAAGFKVAGYRTLRVSLNFGWRTVPSARTRGQQFRLT